MGAVFIPAWWLPSWRNARCWMAPQVDFENGGLHIEKQISLNGNGRPVEAELKAEESEAFVPMPQWYLEELVKYKKNWNKERLMLGSGWSGGDKQYLFHNDTGNCYYPDVPSSHWRWFLDKHSLPRIRLPDLLHTTAMLLREDGASMKSIQERLRHIRLATTADIYTHESELVSRETADRLEKLNPFLGRSQTR